MRFGQRLLGLRTRAFHFRQGTGRTDISDGERSDERRKAHCRSPDLKGHGIDFRGLP